MYLCHRRPWVSSILSIIGESWQVRWFSSSNHLLAVITLVIWRTLDARHDSDTKPNVLFLSVHHNSISLNWPPTKKICAISDSWKEKWRSLFGFQPPHQQHDGYWCMNQPPGMHRMRLWSYWHLHTWCIWLKWLLLPLRVLKRFSWPNRSPLLFLGIPRQYFPWKAPPPSSKPLIRTQRFQKPTTQSITPLSHRLQTKPLEEHSNNNKQQQPL